MRGHEKRQRLDKGLAPTGGIGAAEPAHVEKQTRLLAHSMAESLGNVGSTYEREWKEASSRDNWHRKGWHAR